MYETLAKDLGYVDAEGYADEQAMLAERTVTWEYEGIDSTRKLIVTVTPMNNGERSKVQETTDGLLGTDKIEYKIG